MGFVNSANILCVVFPIERDEIKEAQHLRRCIPLNVLTQGSLHYRLPTLGYQKRNPDGVRFPHEKRSLCAPSLLKEKRLRKRNTDGVEKGISNDDLSFSL